MVSRSERSSNSVSAAGASLSGSVEGVVIAAIGYALVSPIIHGVALYTTTNEEARLRAYKDKVTTFGPKNMGSEWMAQALLVESAIEGHIGFERTKAILAKIGIAIGLVAWLALAVTLVGWKKDMPKLEKAAQGILEGTAAVALLFGAASYLYATRGGPNAQETQKAIDQLETFRIKPENFKLKA